MSSSTSSSEPWKRFFRLASGTAAVAVAIVYAFVVLVDPFDTLPLSPPFDRVPVASNARFAFPSLARAPRFDSALFGTSTSRLLQPAELDPLFGVRLVNLAMNSATVFEQGQMMNVFLHAHPKPKLVMVGLDLGWCVTGDEYQYLTPRPFPAWMYNTNRWDGYAHMLNLYAVQSAGQLFGILIGVKQPDQGSDGYTRFVPPASAYDPVRVAEKLREASPSVPPGPRSGPPETWRFPALELLRERMAALPENTRKLLFFVPYNHVLLSPPDSDAAIAWKECKRRVVAIARDTAHATVVDFMFPNPITVSDDHYWDPLHYTVAIAERLAGDLAAASKGETSEDYRLLWP